MTHLHKHNPAYDPLGAIPYGAGQVVPGAVPQLGYDTLRQQVTVAVNKAELKKQADELYRQLVLTGCSSEDAEDAADKFYKYLTKEIV